MPNKRKNIKRQWVRGRNPFDRDRKRHWFYNTNKWRKVTKLFREQNAICIECEKEGKIKPSQVADHIIPLKQCLEKGINPYSFDNLQALCEYHHNKKSGKESHGL